MTDSEDEGGATVPRPGPPSVSLAEQLAREALDAFPDMVTLRTDFGCVEQVGGRWKIVATGLESPQDARDHLAHLFLLAASQATTDTECEEYRAAAAVLDVERHDEYTVAGRRLRVTRIQRSARSGPDGPEPPRSTDPQGVPGEDLIGAPRRCHGFISEVAQRGTAAAATRYALRNRIPEGDPAAMDDAGRALASHPRIVLLPVEFVAAEEVDGRWCSRCPDLSVTPQDARERLTGYLRPPEMPQFTARGSAELYAEVLAGINARRPRPEVCAQWAQAADRIDAEHLNDISTGGHHFRIIRVDLIMREGSDGPEPPRPSDPDPHGPPGLE